jgi:hypothetical protein
VTCNQEVQAGARACRDHVCQFEGGCLHVRKVKTNGQACDDHTCRIKDCYKTVGIRGRYCRDHTCIWEPCSQRGRYLKSPYCDVHKCKAHECIAPVASKIDAYCGVHKCQYGAGDCLEGWTKAPPFCEAHVCSIKGCRLPVIDPWGPRVCAAHVNYHPPEPKKPSSVVSSSHKRKEKAKQRDPYIEVSDPETCACSDHEGHAARHRSSSKKSRRSEPHGGEEELHESKNGVLTRRNDLTVSTAVRGEVAVRQEMLEYSVARRKGKKVPAPDVFRTDPNYALAYGCGMQDMALMMADMWKNMQGGNATASQAGAAFDPQAAFGQGAFADMDRHLPDFDGPRVVEEQT